MLAFTLCPIDFCANREIHPVQWKTEWHKTSHSITDRFRASGADDMMLRRKLYTACQSGNVCPHCTWRSTKNVPIQRVNRGEQHSSAYAQNCAKIGVSFVNKMVASSPDVSVERGAHCVMGLPFPSSSMLLFSRSFHEIRWYPETRQFMVSLPAPHLCDVV